MERFVVSLETLEKATQYIPLDEKLVIVHTLAEKLTKEIPMGYKETSGNVIPVPSRYEARNEERRMVMAGILMNMYLHMWGAPKEKWLTRDKKTGEWEIKMPIMDVETYDRYGASFVMNQLERLKKNPSPINEVVFNLLADYRDFDRMMWEHVTQELEIKNDSAMRTIMNQMNLADPQTIAEMAKSIVGLSQDLETAKKEGDEALANALNE